MKAKPKTFFGKEKIRGIDKLAYALCGIGNGIIEKLNLNSAKIDERLAQAFYLVPHIIFKGVNRKRYSRK